MEKNSLAARDQRAVVHGLTNLRRHLELGPVIMERGRGVWVTDTQGRRYIEGMAGLWCVALGYGEERLIEAATRQMRELAYYPLINSKSHPPVIELANKLIDMAPVPMSHVWFANSGSEANDCAVRLAWYYWHAQGKPQKRKLIAHRGSYHGNTIASASLSGVRYNHEGFGLPLEGFLHVDCPNHLHGARSGETEEAYATRLVAAIDELIQREGPDTIAAFFTEPVLAAGGVVVPPATYFEQLQRLLQRYDILLVCDEVVTGFGRLGDMFGTQTMGLRPDMMVCAKAITGAYVPMSALLINEKIFQAMLEQSDRLGVFGLTMTYCGHPVAAAVAREAIRIYEEGHLPDRVRNMEWHFLGGLRELQDHPLVGQVRGRGLLAGVELMRKTGEGCVPFPAEYKAGALCQMHAERAGLIIRAIGDTLAFCPPLIINEAEIGELVRRFRTALDATAAELPK